MYPGFPDYDYMLWMKEMPDSNINCPGTVYGRCLWKRKFDRNFIPVFMQNHIFLQYLKM